MASSFPETTVQITTYDQFFYNQFGRHFLPGLPFVQERMAAMGDPVSLPFGNVKDAPAAGEIASLGDLYAQERGALAFDQNTLKSYAQPLLDKARAWNPDDPAMKQMRDGVLEAVSALKRRIAVREANLGKMDERIAFLTSQPVSEPGSAIAAVEPEEKLPPKFQAPQGSSLKKLEQRQSQSAQELKTCENAVKRETKRWEETEGKLQIARNRFETASEGEKPKIAAEIRALKARLHRHDPRISEEQCEEKRVEVAKLQSQTPDGAKALLKVARMRLSAAKLEKQKVYGDLAKLGERLREAATRKNHSNSEIVTPARVEFASLKGEEARLKARLKDLSQRIDTLEQSAAVFAARGGSVSPTEENGDLAKLASSPLFSPEDVVGGRVVTYQEARANFDQASSRYLAVLSSFSSGRSPSHAEFQSARKAYAKSKEDLLKAYDALPRPQQRQLGSAEEWIASVDHHPQQKTALQVAQKRVQDAEPQNADGLVLDYLTQQKLLVGAAQEHYDNFKDRIIGKERGRALKFELGGGRFAEVWKKLQWAYEKLKETSGIPKDFFTPDQLLAQLQKGNFAEPAGSIQRQRSTEERKTNWSNPLTNYNLQRNTLISTVQDVEAKRREFFGLLSHPFTPQYLRAKDNTHKPLDREGEVGRYFARLFTLQGNIHPQGFVVTQISRKSSDLRLAFNPLDDQDKIALGLTNANPKEVKLDTTGFSGLERSSGAEQGYNLGVRIYKEIQAGRSLNSTELKKYIPASYLPGLEKALKSYIGAPSLQDARIAQR